MDKNTLFHDDDPSLLHAQEAWESLGVTLELGRRWLRQREAVERAKRVLCKREAALEKT